MKIVFSTLDIEHQAAKNDKEILALLKGLNIKRFHASITCHDGSFIQAGGSDLQQLYDAINWALKKEKDRENNEGKISQDAV